MVLTRSQENLADLDRTGNVSFTINLDQENNTNQAATTSQSGRARGRSRPNQNQNLNMSQNGQEDSSRVREIVSESLSSFRNEITSEIRSMFQNLNLHSNSNNNPHSPARDNNSATSSPLNSNSPQEPFFA